MEKLSNSNSWKLAKTIENLDDISQSQKLHFEVQFEENIDNYQFDFSKWAIK